MKKPAWAKNFVARKHLRWNGTRWTLPRSKLPFGAEFKDCMPPIEHEGVRMRWVGFGWVAEGEPNGTELLLLEET